MDAQPPIVSADPAVIGPRRDPSGVTISRRWPDPVRQVERLASRHARPRPRRRRCPACARTTRSTRSPPASASQYPTGTAPVPRPASSRRQAQRPAEACRIYAPGPIDVGSGGLAAPAAGRRGARRPGLLRRCGTARPARLSACLTSAPSSLIWSDVHGRRCTAGARDHHHLARDGIDAGAHDANATCHRRVPARTCAAHGQPQRLACSTPASRTSLKVASPGSPPPNHFPRPLDAINAHPGIQLSMALSPSPAGSSPATATLAVRSSSAMAPRRTIRAGQLASSQDAQPAVERLRAGWPTSPSARQLVEVASRGLCCTSSATITSSRIAFFVSSTTRPACQAEAYDLVPNTAKSRGRRTKKR